MTINAITEASIVNMALSRMGSTQSITSLNPSDTSNEAQQARLWYPQDRDAILCDFPWPWAESYMVLDQVAGPEVDDGQVANAQWARTYRYPPDALKIRRLTPTPVQQSTVPPQTTGAFVVNPSANNPWNRADGQPYPISYSVGHDASGRLIMTDAFGSSAGLTCVYTAAVEDPTQFSADFADMLAWRLAVDFAMGLGFSDARRSAAQQMYQQCVNKARATHMNELQDDIPLVRYQSETVRARWGG